MNISDEQVKKIFELASMENKCSVDEISPKDISEALIAIERKIYSFSSEIKSEIVENKKVLIADDLELSIYQLNTLLRKIGIEPIVARNKEEAVSEIQKIHFDCIIIDLFIPDSSDGFELIKTAVARKAEIGSIAKIVVISGTDDASFVDECYELGADFYIQKDKDWHTKLLKYLSNTFQTGESIAFTKYQMNNDTIAYNIKKLHDAKIFDDIKMSINSSIYNGFKNIILDLSEISVFDVENAYIFADIYKICADNNGKLILVNPSLKVKEALEFAYLSDIISYADSVEEATKLI